MFSLTKFKYWMHTRTQEQRYGILLVWFLVCISIWFMVWESPFLARETVESDQLKLLRQKMTIDAQQINEKQNIMNNPAIMQKYKLLASELNDLNEQLESIYTQLVSSAEMVKAMKSVVEENSGLKLLELSNTGNFLLDPHYDKTIVGKDGIAKFATVKKLYRHNFTMVFSGNYLETVNYFKKIEKLPWKFYWDSVDYQVTKYPEAQITIKLHTISASEGVMNA